MENEIIEKMKADMWAIQISTGAGGYRPLGSLMALCGFEEERDLIDKNITKIVEAVVNYKPEKPIENGQGNGQ